MNKRRYRVVQWGGGNIGPPALRGVIEHPDLDLVGVYVYSDDKVGRDAGELCGLDPVGIKATRDIEEILALKPDCVLYMANWTAETIDVVCRLLESGANVVCSTGEFYYPAGMDPARRQRYEEACRRGGTSVHSTGSTSGFITEAAAIAMTSMSHRLDLLTFEEYCEMSSRTSVEMVLGMFGGDPATDPFVAQPTHPAHSSFSLIADAMSVSFDEVVASHEVAVARRDVDIYAGTIKAGTVGGRRSETTGLRNGKPIMRTFQTHYITTDLEPAWELPTALCTWRLLIEGDAPLDVHIDFPVPPEDWWKTSPGYTANRPVNAVPVVCEAEPGIVSAVDLPQVIANFGGERSQNPLVPTPG